MPYSVLYAELLLDFSVSQTPSCDPAWGNGVGDDVWGVSMYKQTHTLTLMHTHMPTPQPTQSYRLCGLF